MAEFKKAFDFTIANEGEFSNIPEDHGGPTKYGITMSTLSRWRKKPVSIDDVKNLLPSEAYAIYEAWYWRALGMDLVLENSKAIAIFDHGVLYGIYTSAKMAQQACNDLGAQLVEDGHLGPKSIAEINIELKNRFIYSFVDRAKARAKAIVFKDPSQRVFLDGWLNRADRLLKLV
jgi:lysozyme family protein